jgi:hypothetical protein
MDRNFSDRRKRSDANGSRQRRWLYSIGLVVMAGFISIPVLLAVHQTGRFELDGNATTVSSDDWDEVCHQATNNAACGTTSNTNGAIAVSWTGDCPQGSSGFGCTTANATIFQGGGSKDPQDINNWAWKDELGGLPDKDNLVHSFAARYSLTANPQTCPSGTATTCEVIFFGSDRFDNSGDAQQGFWFLQNAVTLGNNKVGGALGFSGLHRLGDLLVISDFSNGGTTSVIKVFKWQPICTATNKSSDTNQVPNGACADANLQTLASSDDANCDTINAGTDQFCGIVNTTTITPQWANDYIDKSGNGYLPGEFFEAGINLSLLGLANECFSSVLSETRSSTSTTATLKDFVLGSFAVCTPNLTTQASASPVDTGTQVRDTATIQIQGAISPPDPIGDVTFYICGPLAQATVGCASNDSSKVQVGSSSVPLDGGANANDGLATAVSAYVNTATAKLAPGRYCFRAEWPGDTRYPGAVAHTNNTIGTNGECFIVNETYGVTTAQKWLPNDTATVTTGSGGAASGFVTFKLYENGDCTGSPVQTFANKAVSGGNASTDNSTTYIVITPGKTISWKADFLLTSGGAVVASAPCEKSIVTIDDDITD